MSSPFIGNGGEEKIELMRGFKCAIAFENSDTPDYVGKKFAQVWTPLKVRWPLLCCCVCFVQALVAGAVPIVKSRKTNYEVFAPHPHSFIVAEDFDSPQVWPHE